MRSGNRYNTTTKPPDRKKHTTMAQNTLTSNISWWSSRKVKREEGKELK
jgi:hypothetical protein